MKKAFPKRTATILAAICLTGIFTWHMHLRTYSPKDTVDITQIPLVIGAWKGVEIPISPEDLAILETNNAIARKYINTIDKSEILLYIVYSQTNRKVAHPPEICYTGHGLTIIGNTHDPIITQHKGLVIDANRLRLSKGNFEQFSYYWFKVGSHFSANYWLSQLLVVYHTLFGKNSGNALIRVSSEIIDRDEKATITIIKAFTNELVPVLFKHLP